jgi:Transcriptional regulators
MREYDVLYTLSKDPEPLRLSELNRHVLLSQPALSRLVERLAERGLVSRHADPADGRGVRLLAHRGRADHAARDRPPPRPQRDPGHDRRADPRRDGAAGNDLPEAGVRQRHT